MFLKNSKIFIIEYLNLFENFDDTLALLMFHDDEIQINDDLIIIPITDEICMMSDLEMDDLETEDITTDQIDLALQ